MNFSFRFVERKGRMLLRLIMSALLMLGVLGGVSSWTASRVQAADPANFAAAQVTPADIASLVALSTDLSSPQFVLAQALIARIAGESVDPEATTTSMEQMLPEELAGMPELVDGQIAFTVQPAMLDLGMLQGMVEDGEIESDLTQPSAALDQLDADSLSGFSVVITASNLDEIGAFLEAEMRGEAQDTGAVIATIEGPGGGTVLVIEQPDDVSETSSDDTLGFRAMTQLDDAIVLATRAEDVLPFVQVAAGEIPSLVDNVGYQSAMATLPTDVLVGGYSAGLSLDILSQVQELLNQASIPIALDLITRGIGPSAFAVYASEEGFRFESASLPGVDVPGTPTAVSDSAVQLTMADRVSADSLLFISGTDPSESAGMRAIEQMVLFLLTGTTSGENEPFTQVTEQLIADQYQALEMLLGFNAQTDLFRQLNQEFGLVVSAVDLTNPEGIGVLFAAGVEHPEIVDQTVDSIGQLLQFLGEDAPPIQEVTVGETTVSQITLTSEGSTVDIQFGVVGDELLVGFGTGLTEYVLGVSQPLSANPLYLESMGYLPEPETGIFYVNAPDAAALGLMFGSLFPTSSFDESASGSWSSMDVDEGIVDASEQCGEYADQSEAQFAYDSDPVTNFDLDFDFDGVACDDYFGTTESSSSESTPSMGFETTIEVNIGALAAVSYRDGSIERTSGILVVPVKE